MNPTRGCDCEFCTGKKNWDDNWCPCCAEVMMTAPKWHEDLDVCDSCEKTLKQQEMSMSKPKMTKNVYTMTMPSPFDGKERDYRVTVDDSVVVEVRGRDALGKDAWARAIDPGRCVEAVLSFKCWQVGSDYRRQTLGDPDEDGVIWHRMGRVKVETTDRGDVFVFAYGDAKEE